MVATMRTSTSTSRVLPTGRTCHVSSTRSSVGWSDSRDLGHIVEQQRPSAGGTEKPLLFLDRPRERAAHMPEQLTREQALGERTAAHSHERPCPPAAPVDLPRDDLLACSGLAGDDHRAPVWRDGVDAASDGRDGRTRARQLGLCTSLLLPFDRTRRARIHEERVAEAQYVSLNERVRVMQRLAVEPRACRAAEIPHDGALALHADLGVLDRHPRVVEGESNTDAPRPRSTPPREIARLCVERWPSCGKRQHKRRPEGPLRLRGESRRSVAACDSPHPEGRTAIGGRLGE